MSDTLSLPRLWLRLLTFRASHADYASLDWRHLLAGLAACWVVGMGRYWDDPRATFLQHLVLGSVIYVFALAAVLWVITKPVDVVTATPPPHKPHRSPQAGSHARAGRAAERGSRPGRVGELRSRPCFPLAPAGGGSVRRR